MPHLAPGVMQTACQHNQLVDTVEVSSLTGSSVPVLRHDSCLYFPTVACASDRRRGPKGLFFKTNGNVAGRRQRDLEKARMRVLRCAQEVTKPLKTRGERLLKGRLSLVGYGAPILRQISLATDQALRQIMK